MMSMKEEIEQLNADAAKIASLRVVMEDELRSLNVQQTLQHGFASEATAPMLPEHHPFFPDCCDEPAHAAVHDWLSCFAHDVVLAEQGVR